MQLVKEKRIGDIYTATYETNGYIVVIHTVDGNPPTTTVTCETKTGMLYRPKIICSPSGICIAYENVCVSYSESSRWMEDMIGEARHAKNAADEIYALLKSMNFFA